MKITRKQLRRIIREELLKESPIDIPGGPHGMDPMQQAELQRTGAADHMRDQMSNTYTLGDLLFDLVEESVEFVLDLAEARIELQANIALAIQAEPNSKKRSKYLTDATNNATELAVGNLWWYGPGLAFRGLGAATRHTMNKIKSVKSRNGLPLDPPTAADQQVLKQFRSEVLTDELILKAPSASTKEKLQKSADLIDDAIEANRKYSYKKPSSSTKRGRSDPMMNPVQKIQSATKQASQSLPGEKVSLALARKPKPHPPAVPKMISDVPAGVYLRLSQGVRRSIEATLRRKASVRVVSHGGSRGIGVKIGDALDDNAFKVLYDDTVERFPDAKSLWPDQDSFKSFVGEVDIQFFDKSASARAAMQGGDEGFRLRMSSGADVDRLTPLIQRQGAQHGDSFTGDIPGWVYTRLRDDDFTHEFTHHIDKLTGIMRAGRTQSAGKLGYSSWVHEINARYIAAIEEVERRLIAGDKEMISLLRGGDELNFANVFMDIVDAKRSGGSYEGISALPVEVMAEMYDQILRPGGAYSILKQAIPEGTIREGSFTPVSHQMLSGICDMLKASNLDKRYGGLTVIERALHPDLGINAIAQSVSSNSSEPPTEISDKEETGLAESKIKITRSQLRSIIDEIIKN